MKELVSGGPFEKLPYLPQILSRPGWLIQFLMDGGVPLLPNVVVPGKGPLPLVDVASALAESAVTWDDFQWIREHWGGPIVVKGVLTGRMRGGLSITVPRLFQCRIMAAANSMEFRHRCGFCPKS